MSASCLLPGITIEVSGSQGMHKILLEAKVPDTSPAPLLLLASPKTQCCDEESVGQLGKWHWNSVFRHLLAMLEGLESLKEKAPLEYRLVFHLSLTFLRVLYLSSPTSPIHV